MRELVLLDGADQVKCRRSFRCRRVRDLSVRISQSRLQFPRSSASVGTLPTARRPKPTWQLLVPENPCEFADASVGDPVAMGAMSTTFIANAHSDRTRALRRRSRREGVFDQVLQAI